MQQGHATEGPRAGATLVLLHLRVGLQVGAQVGSISKSPVTVLTSEGALTWWNAEKQSVSDTKRAAAINRLVDQKKYRK